jgi:CHAD domain-containing protein
VAVTVTGAIRRALGRVLEVGSDIGPDTDPEALHRLRILCKKLRYLITLFRSLFPPEELGPIVAELKQLQSHLGEFNDLHVEQVALRTSAEELMATGSGPPSTLLAMGQLLGRLEGEQTQHRAAFRTRFSRFARKKNLKRFEALFGAWEDKR